MYLFSFERSLFCKESDVMFDFLERVCELADWCATCHSLYRMAAVVGIQSTVWPNG